MASARSLFVCSGWRATRLLPAAMARALRGRLRGDGRSITPVWFTLQDAIEPAADVLIDAVDRVAPNDDPARTSEVDVVSVSMAGLVARYAAAFGVSRDTGMRTLSIGTLFTVSTPHRGAKLAKRIALDEAARQMRPGSAFLERLNAQPIDYDLVCYARTRDWWVGAMNTAPPGMDPIWVRPPLLTLSHLLVSRDGRILDDIAARLMGEAPVLGPASRPPGD